MQIQNEQTIKQIAAKLVDTNIEWIEEGILVMAVRDPKFWKSHCRGVINGRYGKSWFEDFSKPAFSLLYRVASKYYESFEDASPLSQDVMVNLLASEYKEGNCSQDDLTVAMRKTNEIWEHNPDNLRDTISHAIRPWLNRRRTLQVGSRISVYKDMSAGDIAEQLQEIERSTTGSERAQEPGIDEFLDAAERGETEIKEYFPMPSLGIFNYSLGNGLIPGTCGLVVVPSNGGKTIMANMMSGDLALDCVPNLLISTEQSAAEMYYRQWSCFANVPFEKIHKGFKKEDLESDEWDRIRQYTERVKPYMKVENLGQNPLDLTKDLDVVLEDWNSKGFFPRVVFLDWLGANSDGLDAAQKSNWMSESIKKFRDKSREHNLAFVVFAQGHPDKCLRKRYITERDVSGCNILHVYADWGCGISKLPADTKETDSVEDSQKADSDIQYCNFFKTRDNPPKRFKAVREFEYQRFRFTDDNQTSSQFKTSSGGRLGKS